MPGTRKQPEWRAKIYRLVADRMDPSGASWIFRRVERVTFEQDKAIRHEISFDCKIKWKRRRRHRLPAVEMIPLVMLPKRTLYRLRLAHGDVSIPILTREQNAELTVNGLLELLRRRAPAVADSPPAELEWLECQLEKLIRRSAPTAGSCLKEIEDRAERDESSAAAKLLAEDDLRLLVERLVAHRWLFVPVPTDGPDRQVIRFSYSEYLDHELRKRWVDHHFVLGRAFENQFPTVGRGVRWLLSRRSPFFAPVRWATLQTVERLCPLVVVPIMLLPPDHQLSYRLEFEAPQGIDVAEVEVYPAPGRQPTEPVSGGPKPILRSVEQLEFSDHSTDGDPEATGFLAHVHYSERAVDELRAHGSATALVQLRTSRRGAMDGLRRAAAANTVIAAVAALSMRKLLLTESDAVVALLLAVSASIPIVLTRTAGMHALASFLLGRPRRYAFLSAVGLYVIAGMVPLFSATDYLPGDSFAAPAWSAQTTSIGVFLLNVVLWLFVRTNWKLSQPAPFLESSQRWRYSQGLRRTAVGLVCTGVVLAAVLRSPVEPAPGAAVFLPAELASHAPRGVAPPLDELSKLDQATLVFRPEHRLFVGLPIVNRGAFGVTVANVERLPAGFHLASAWVGPPYPTSQSADLASFRPFALRPGERRYLVLEVVVQPCSPRSRERMQLSHIGLGLRTFEIPRAGGVDIELPTPVVVTTPASTWCPD